ncbi:MAG: D-aminoacyl-tRNA deacylase [Pseudomonadales bacterium]|jgi:D-tyrosyl-tRNA(Tyr) deacylase
MKALIQRVAHASVTVEGQVVGRIHRGLLVFLGIDAEDDNAVADRLLSKVLNYRVFPDENEHMNLSVQDIKGELLIVSQFTLSASTNKGLRPSFSAAKAPALAEPLYAYFVEQATKHIAVETGEFGADMKVELLNDGPVTFLLSMD